MITSWLIYSVLIFIIIYLLIMMNFTKTLHKKERLVVAKKDRNIDDLKVMIKKYRVQLQRAIGDIDILTGELANARNDLKNMRAKNSQQRLEIDQLMTKVRDLEEKIEAFI